ncbi:MAG: SDR family NAD(P)-dependent oxidoreductase [Bacteroidetes bacterium]|nr:SDR family NAD(P)-dependent oxidoreductase [Bacteroidota bacterium]
MKKEISKLIEISRFYGRQKEFVIGGGGNTSYKDNKHLWVKASGISLADIDEDGFALLSRERLLRMRTEKYSDDPVTREKEVKNDMIRSLIDPVEGKRPSVETLLHDSLEFKYVVHTHPTMVNAIMCSREAGKSIIRLFKHETIFVEYSDPGYVLSGVVDRRISEFKEKHGNHPQIIFLGNHGLFVGADNVKEIKELHQQIIETIKSESSETLKIEEETVDARITGILPAIRMMMTGEGAKTARIRNNSLIAYYSESIERFREVSIPATPDMVVFCKPSWLYIENTNSVEDLINEAQKKINNFKIKHGYYPKILVLKNLGVIGLDENDHSLSILLDVFEDLLKVNHYTKKFGGYKPLTPEQIKFLDEWEVEQFRRKLLKEGSLPGVLQNKIAVVTGGAQGFGAGIVKALFEQGASVVVADLKIEKGETLVKKLNRSSKSAGALFVETDVSNEKSIENMVFETVKRFGGIDILISNAGVLKAGSLEEMDPEIFDFVTSVNYKGYFNCTRQVSKVMKLQNQYNPDEYFNIIQVNSKSGLKGSNRNFAYAGSKFGGIGLTQSFALELADNKIKVNSICPGNYFDGPLWSDPDNGLFVQYLEAGKVEGAKTMEDVKRYYEKQVPMGRGCSVEDVMVAIRYVVEQKYETGQAVAVTGGQIMLR